MGPMPLFDYDYLETASPLKVAILLDNYAIDYGNSINTLRFLEKSGHSTYAWESIGEFDSLEYLINEYQIDSVLLASMDRFEIPPATRNVIRDFAYSGGRVVSTGPLASYNLNDLFGTNFQPIRYYAPDTNFNDRIFPYGYNVQAKFTPGNLFSPYYDYGRTLPSFFDYNVLNSTFIPINGGSEYCAYAFARDSSYCALWSKAYYDGDISALAFNFGAG